MKKYANGLHSLPVLSQARDESQPQRSTDPLEEFGPIMPKPTMINVCVEDFTFLAMSNDSHFLDLERMPTAQENKL